MDDLDPNMTPTPTPNPNPNPDPNPDPDSNPTPHLTLITVDDLHPDMTYIMI